MIRMRRWWNVFSSMERKYTKVMLMIPGKNTKNKSGWSRTLIQGSIFVFEIFSQNSPNPPI